MNVLKLLSGNNQSDNLSPTTPDMGVIEPQSSPINQLGNDTLQPSNDIQNKLIELLGQMPKHSDNEPSTGRKIMSAIAGLSAVGPAHYYGGTPVGFDSDPKLASQIQQGILSGPYNRKMDDFQNQLKPLEVLGNLENAHNTNERLVRSSEGNQKIQSDKLKETIDQNDVKNKQNEEKITIQKSRADAYVEKSKRPNFDSFIDSDGQLVFVNKSDPNDIQYTGIDTGKLSDEDRINLGIKGRLQVTNVQHSNRIDEINTSGNVQKEIKQTPVAPKVTDKKNLLPGQIKTKQQLRAQEAINTHPEWKEYIHLLPGGLFDVSIPEGKNSILGGITGSNTPGGSPDVLKQINQFIYQDDERIPVNDGTKNFTIPKSQLEAAKAKGYKEGKLNGTTTP